MTRFLTRFHFLSAIAFLGIFTLLSCTGAKESTAILRKKRHKHPPAMVLTKHQAKRSANKTKRAAVKKSRKSKQHNH